jgi:chromatin remodeling complex protein RSC6
MALNSAPVRKTRGAAQGKPKTKPKSKPRKKKQNDGQEGDDTPKKKREPNLNNAFHQPMLLSPQLSEVVFETELSRPVHSLYLRSMRSDA